MGSFGQSEFVSIENLHFRVYKKEDIKKISVLRITNHETFNQLGHLAPNGLYDLHLGPVGSNDKDMCMTCRLKSYYCAGHCGHIELPLPVYNPVFYDTLRRLVKSVCFNCYKFTASKESVLRFTYQMKLLRKGLGIEALDFDNFVSQTLYNGSIIDNGDKSVGKQDNDDEAVSAFEEILDAHYTSVAKNSTVQNYVTSNYYYYRDQIAKSLNLSKKKCPYCLTEILKLNFQNSRFIKQTLTLDKKLDGSQEEHVLDSQSYLTPEQIQNALRNCWKVDSEVLSCLFPILSVMEMEHPTDIFFLSTLLVIPPKFRPYTKQFDGFISEHESIPILKNIIKLSKYILPLISLISGSLEVLPDNVQKVLSEISGKTTEEKLQNMWHQIQCNVDNLYDASLTTSKQITTKGIRQVIEKKHGLMRHNLMGKRVNYSARSVAAPDPHIGVDEVGVPMDFAIKLSYPVPVTDWNVEEMRKLVLNGTEKYPGALIVEDEEGKKVVLSRLNKTQRGALAKKLMTPVESHVKKVNAQKIVHRQLKNGDYVLMNRQPTLHRPSIQAHRVRVMAKDRVLRMPYANCKAYNADFDGDEFNMHFPQNELSRSEASQLIMTYNQYLTPKDGSPLAGLIQDCVVSSVMITMRGTFFSREDYQQLVYSSLPDHVGKILCLPPSIIKPNPLWSGKQVISTLLHNIIPSGKARPSFTFKTSVKADIWQTKEVRKWKAGGCLEKKRETMTESDFVMRDGELLCGVVDKSAIGSTSHGLIHTCCDLYGGPVAYKLLTAINRLCVYYLQWVGHTIAVKDFITPTHVSHRRRKQLSELVKSAPCEVSRKLGIEEDDFQDYFESAHMSRNDKNMAAIDAAYTGALGSTTSKVTAENERQLFRPNLDNHMRMMVDTGAKGSKVNMNQMASLFGSVAIDGKRMPMSVVGKTLPSFKAYDPNPCAGGYIPNRFMTGINPKSYFFLCIVGRDSLQHTAVKTANSGYVQRCLIKHLEGIRVDYDMTVRNSDGLVLQFSYGEDGLDVTKVPFMSQPSTMDVLVTNYSRLIDDRSLATAQSIGERKQVEKYAKTLKKIKRKKSTERQSGFLRFCKKVGSTIKVDGFNNETGRLNVSRRIENLWRNLSASERENYNVKTRRCPDPIASVFSSASNLGVVSEALDELIDNYYSEYYLKRPIAEQNMTKEDITRTIHMKALMSKVDPGEAVGALCAQALGEPLTQMTLNTFHFAGKDELNVTLGVPRMIEILRTGSKMISTPIMEIPFYPHISRQQAESLRLRLSEVSLAKVLSLMNVVSQVEKNGKNNFHRIVTVRFSFLPHKQYKHIFAVTPSEILRYVEKTFLIKLLSEIYKSLHKHKLYCTVAKAAKSRRKKVEDDDNDVAEEEEQQQNRGKSSEGYVEAGNSDESDDNDEANDGDTLSSAKAKKASEQDYSEDEDAELSDKANDDNDDGYLTENNDSEEEPQLSQKKSYTSKVWKVKKSVNEKEASKRIANVKLLSTAIIDYVFDREKQLWCEVKYKLPWVEGYDIASIVREQSQRAFISNVPGIRRVFVVENNDILMLRTEGVNVLKISHYEHMLNLNKLYTNNIHQVATMYGIEAAQRSVIREIRAVQSAYNIKVDFRHLSLLADYFTWEGTYKACSRTSISSCSSPIQKMSFETCFNFLKSAILHDEVDEMESPSASIALGQPAKVGTNTMQLRHVYNRL